MTIMAVVEHALRINYRRLQGSRVLGSCLRIRSAETMVDRSPSYEPNRPPVSFLCDKSAWTNESDPGGIPLQLQEHGKCKSRRCSEKVGRPTCKVGVLKLRQI